jgi:thiol-disulfide isomerase/thioredoxin
VASAIIWLQGTLVSKFELGRVYGVEFCATWCPLCIKAISHLSELQRKYASALFIPVPSTETTWWPQTSDASEFIDALL